MADDVARPLRGRRRQWLTHVLVALSALLVVVSTVAVWTTRTVLDTERFMATVEPALDDPALQIVVADAVSAHTLEVLDLETRVSARLVQLDEYLAEALLEGLAVDAAVHERLSGFDRPSLAALAPPITTALEERVELIVDGLVTSEQFRIRLAELVEQAHRGAVALIRDDLAALPNVYIADGEVQLDLISIIGDVIRQVADESGEFLPDVELPAVVDGALGAGRQQLADALGTRIPDDLGQVTVMSEDTLGEAQQVANRVDRLLWLVLLVTVATTTAAIAVSRNRRRTVAQVGMGVLVGVILGAAAIRGLQEAVVGEMASPEGARAAGMLLSHTITSLRTVALVVGAVALAAVVVAYVAGRSATVRRWLPGFGLASDGSSTRRLDRWVHQHYDLLRIAVAAAAVLAVFVTGIHLVAILIVASITALLLWVGSQSRRRLLASGEPPSVEPQPTSGR